MTEMFSYAACRQLSQMFFAVIFFHISEYILAVAIHGRSSVTVRSLLISKNYLLAMIFSLLEYVVEIYFFSGSKEHWWISNLGLAMVVIGETIRKLAIQTAGRSFTHLIKIYHEKHHKLVTHGVYRADTIRGVFLEAVFWVRIRGVYTTGLFWDSFCEMILINFTS